MTDIKKTCALGNAIIETEIEGIRAVQARLGENFANACEVMLHCKGRVVVTGMGKSGHIGRKIAATMASTGTPSFFVHPAEAAHGDLGMLTKNDVVLAISNSGKTDEVVGMLPLIKQLNIPLIAMTGKVDSTLAKAARIHLDISIPREACSMDIVPSTSTTVTLVLGDALAITLLELKGFTADDFAQFHPGGALGRRLSLYVKDIMHAGNEMPTVTVNTPILQVLEEMSKKTLGVAVVIDEDQRILGIFTDGDVRRMAQKNLAIQDMPIEAIMTPNCIKIRLNLPASNALEIMEQHKITTLLVVDEKDRLAGVVHIHDLLT